MSRKLTLSSAVFASMTALSRVMGFIRDIVLAQLFGAGAAIDAFFVAFKIPNFMRRLFAEGAFSQAFIPVLSEFKQKESEETIKQFINRMSGTLGLALLIVTTIAVIATPVFVVLFAPGYLQDPQRFSLTSDMLKLTFPYLLFISLTAFAGAVLNTYGRFAIPAFTPVLLNICLIIAAVFFAPYFSEPVMALAWGVFIAGIVQLFFQLPFLFRIGLLPKPQVNWKDPGVKKVLKLMVPAIFGVSVAQINLLIGTLLASFLVAGSISWLYYADRLMSLPLGIFGVAISTVILPHLAQKHADSNQLEFNQSLNWGIKSILLIALPSMIGLIALAEPIVATLFQRGEFTAHDVKMSAYALIAFSIGLPGFMLLKVLASGFYARQNIKTPVKIAVIALIVNLLLSLILMFPLAHIGLALATSLAALVNTILLAWKLYQEKIYTPTQGWKRFILQIALANGLMLAAILYLNTNNPWLEWDNSKKIIELLLILTAAKITYFATLWLTGMRLRRG